MIGLTCAALLCLAGSTCVMGKGDAKCVPKNKPGFCPEQPLRSCLPNKHNSTDQCFDDANCAGDHKCCADVCRKECKTPITPCAAVKCDLTTTCVVVNGHALCKPRVRPGKCPNIPPGGINCPTEPPPNSCEDDSVCGSGEKCCASGCDHSVCKPALAVCTISSCCNNTAGTPVCVEVTTKTLQQTTNVLPKCSALSSNDDHCTGKSNACKANQTCLMTRRCSSDESTKVCFPAVTCTDQIKSENPCDLIACRPNQQCIVQKSLPPKALCIDNLPAKKPGQCPALPPGTIGTCMKACTNDFNCTGDSKCCSNGCGHVCEAPDRSCSLTCPSGLRCQLVDPPCRPDSEPKDCLLRPICVPDSSSVTTTITTQSTTPVSTTTMRDFCAGHVCPAGQCCVVRKISCVWPCLPFPSCVNCLSTSTSTPTTSTQKPPYTSPTSKPYQASSLSGPSNHIGKG